MNGHGPTPVDPIDSNIRLVPEAAQTAAQIRFCPSCGASWLPEWAQCEVCTAAKRPREIGRRGHGSEARPVRTALALYFLLLFTNLVAILALDDELIVELSVSIADTVIVLCFILWNWRLVRGALQNAGPPAFYGGALAIAFGTFVLSTGVVKALSTFARVPELHYLPPFFERGYGWGLVILAICIQPAVVEELAFRGIIFSALRRVLSARETIVVSALVFMIIHLSVPSFPHLFIIGLALGYLRVRTGSLYPGMALHFTHNLLCVLTESWLG